MLPQTEEMAAETSQSRDRAESTVKRRPVTLHPPITASTRGKQLSIHSRWGLESMLALEGHQTDAVPSPLMQHRQRCNSKWMQCCCCRGCFAFMC